MNFIVLFCVSICLSYAGYWIGCSLEFYKIKWISMLASLIPSIVATAIIVLSIDKEAREKEALEKNRIRLARRRSELTDHAFRYSIFTGILSCFGAVIFAWERAGLLVALGIFVIGVFAVLLFFGLIREIFNEPI